MAEKIALMISPPKRARFRIRSRISRGVMDMYWNSRVRGRGMARIQMKRYPAHSGQKRFMPLSSREPLKQDVFDRIVIPSQFVDEDLLQTQGQRVHVQGLQLL